MKAGIVVSIILAGAALGAAEVWRFAPERMNPGKGSTAVAAEGGYRLGADARFYAKDTIGIDPETRYTIGVLARRAVGTTGNPRLWVVMEMLDKDGKVLEPAAWRIASEELGELTGDVKHGDRTLRIKGADKWLAVNGGKVLAFDAKSDQSDLPNFALSSRIENISPEGVVTLARPVYRDYPAGTVVRCHREAAPFDTVIRCDPPETWQYFDAGRKGISSALAPGQFASGTAAIRLRVLTDGEVEIRDLTVQTDSPAGGAERKKELSYGKNARPDLVARVKEGKLTEAKLSWWGEPDGDVTARLQDALDSGAKKLVIDKADSPWITEPLTLNRDGFELVFASGAELVAKRDAFHGRGDSVLTLTGRRDVTVRGEGAGGVIRMHKADYQDPKRYTRAEWRNCITIRGGKNIRIENLRLAESGGDGILVSHYKADFPEHIVIRKVDCDGNHRQGLSIICGTDILVEDSVFRNTRGTNPESGIDVESNKDDDPVRKVVIRNCELRDNAGHGLIISLTRLDSRVVGPFDVTMENCRSINNQMGDFFLTTRSRWVRYREETEGLVNVRNCVFSNDVHRTARHWPIDMDFDVRHKVTVNFDGVSVRRGPNRNGAVRIAHCLPDAGHPAVPQSRVNFRNFRAEDVPDNALLRFADHSFSGADGLVTGIPFTPVKYPQVSADRKFVPQPGSPAEETFPPVYQALKADFWLDCRAGEPVKFTLRYPALGRRSGGTVVTLISPDGARRKLGLIFPNKSAEFSLTPETSGFYRVEVRGGTYPKIALEKSNVPAGIFADPADTILYEPGTVYFRVPENSGPFAVRIWGRSNVLAVKAEIFTPDGERVFAADSIREGVQFTPDAALRDRAGVWKMVFSKPASGYFAKYHVALPGLPPYLGVVPRWTPEVKGE